MALENPCQLVDSRHLALDIEGAVLRVETAGKIEVGEAANTLADEFRIGLRNGDGVHVRHKKEGFVLFLILKELTDAAAIVADGEFAARLKA